MKRHNRLLRAKMAVLVTGACVFGGGSCVSQSVPSSLADQTATRFATLLIDALIFNPLEDALDGSADQTQ